MDGEKALAWSEYLPEITAEIIASATEACPGDTIALMGTEADWIEWIDTSKTLVPVVGAEALAAPTYTTTYGLIAANACSGDTAYYTVKVMPRRLLLLCTRNKRSHAEKFLNYHKRITMKQYILSITTRLMLDTLDSKDVAECPAPFRLTPSVASLVSDFCPTLEW